MSIETLLFPRLLELAFDALPGSVKRLHLRAGPATYTGQVTVTRSPRRLSRLCAWATRLPPAGSGPIQVDIDATVQREIWTRRVANHAMRSCLWVADGLLCERLGPVTFGFKLTIENDRIIWRVARVRTLGVPLPVCLFSDVRAHEGETDDGRYTFDVRAALPLIGPLVHYRGWLHVEQ